MLNNGVQGMNAEDPFVWLTRLGNQFKTGFVLTDPNKPNNPIVFVNTGFTKITGYTQEEVVGKSSDILNGKDTNLTDFHDIETMLKEKEFVNKEILNYKKDGTPFWSDIVVQPLQNGHQQVLFHIGIFMDVTKQKQQEAVIHLQQEIYSGIEKGFPLHVLLQEICSTAESFLPMGAMCSILKIVDERFISIGAANSLPAEYNKVINGIEIGPSAGSCGTAAFRKEMIITDNIQHSPLWAQYRDITSQFNLKACWSFPIINHENIVISTFGIYFSETKNPTNMDMEFIGKITPLVLLAFKNAENQEQILNLAYMDKQTGLPNYNYFASELLDMLNNFKNGFAAIIYPKEYPNIIDLYGRNVGSELIRQLSELVREEILERDLFIARYSDSSLILAGKLTEDCLYTYLERLFQITKKPFIIEHIEVFISLRIGAVPFKFYNDSIDEFVRLGDIALSQSKKYLENSVVLFEEQYNHEIQKNMDLQNALVHAINEKEFIVHLQPKVNLQSYQIDSFEALARWNSSRLGSVGPDVFIPAAEAVGKIQELDILILEQVLDWLRLRQQSNLPLYKVSINISPNHFYTTDFAENLAKRVKKHGISPKYICIELTESIGLVDINLAKTILTGLRDEGFESSVDDFGIGFSSLSYLNLLPVSEIKIDRSFINDLNSIGTKAVVQTIIHLAKNLNMTAVVEGIETEGQLRILQELNCQIGQGFYFYKPMSLDEIDIILKT